MTNQDTNPSAAEPVHPPALIEALRRQALATSHAELQATFERGEPIYTTSQMLALFDVLGYSAPFVVVVRKADGVKGSLQFTHSPRYYFGFVVA